MDTVKVLMLGDIMGRPGCRAIFIGLKSLIHSTGADIVVANGENASDGKGIFPQDLDGLYKSGVHVVTSGNHIWQKKEILPILDEDQRLLRPANYPDGVPGKGWCVVPIRDTKVAVCNLQGRVQLPDILCPFKTGEDLSARLRRETNIILIDFHAEFPEEKEALAFHLDGKVTAVIGTHTHVQTADEKILEGGTGYITDIGMTGPSDSVIGMQVDTAILRGLTQMPLLLEVGEHTAEINGILLQIDAITGRTVSIERIKEKSLV